jgi:hypothetical protein
VAEQHQSVDEMRSDETGTTGDYKSQRSHYSRHSPRIRFRSAFGRRRTGGNFATVVYWIVFESLSYTDSEPWPLTVLPATGAILEPSLT